MAYDWTISCSSSVTPSKAAREARALAAIADASLLLTRCEMESKVERAEQLYHCRKGEKFQRGKHASGTEVKAITYSAMQIIEQPGDAEVFVIVDI